jgi:hypothetical protein
MQIALGLASFMLLVFLGIPFFFILVGLFEICRTMAH